MKTYTTVNFSNICDDALNLFSNALHLIILLAQEEKWNPNMEEEMYVKVENECSSVIYSCLKPNNNTKIDIYEPDIELFLRNIGIISGDLKNAKKSHKAKLQQFRDYIIYTDIYYNPINMFLLFLEAFDNTKCFDIDYAHGYVSRHDFDNLDIHPSTNRIPYLYHPIIDNSAKPYQRKGTILRPFLGGGVNPR